MTKALPSSIQCPACGAVAGQGCYRVGSPTYPTSTHSKRWHAVGISKPTPEDRRRDIEALDRRKMTVAAEMRDLMGLSEPPDAGREAS